MQVYLQVYYENNSNKINHHFKIKGLFSKQFLNISLSKHIRGNNAQNKR